MEIVGDGPGRVTRINSGKSGWRWSVILTRNFQISAVGIAAPFGLQVGLPHFNN